MTVDCGRSEIELRAAALFEFVGLDWRPEFEAFHETRRSVMTFSAAQVRRPLSPAKPGVIQSYGELLAPLTAGLRTAGVDLETGALASKETPAGNQ